MQRGICAALKPDNQEENDPPLQPTYYFGSKNADARLLGAERRFHVYARCLFLDESPNALIGVISAIRREKERSDSANRSPWSRVIRLFFSVDLELRYRIYETRYSSQVGHVLRLTCLL